MSVIKSIVFIDENCLHKLEDTNLYITFTRSLYKKLSKNYNCIYIFDIKYNNNLKNFISNLEKSLFDESTHNPSKKWIAVSYKFIYKYYLAYDQFYTRIKELLKTYDSVEDIHISANSPNILKDPLVHLCKLHNIKLIENNNKFYGFSDFSSFMGVDLPAMPDTEKSNIFIKIIGLYYRFTGHDTFILPCSLGKRLPRNVNLLRVNFFSIFKKIKYLLYGNKKNKYLSNLAYIDFDNDFKNIYKLNKRYWNNFRDDQIEFIEKIINHVSTEYPNEYLDMIQSKLKILFSLSRTKKIIVDDTNDILKRIMIITAREMKIKIEFLPHGLICEDEYIYAIKHLAPNIKVLAWNNDSSKYFENNNILSECIHYPLHIKKKNLEAKKNILILISGNRQSLNNFERILSTLYKDLIFKNYTVDCKFHQISNKDEINVINRDIKNIESAYNFTVNIIDNDVEFTNIAKNYDKLIFTTWTTGIFEASYLKVPFIIYTDEAFSIHAFDSVNIPEANSIDECVEFIENTDTEYLHSIKHSLYNNIDLNRYLSRRSI